MDSEFHAELQKKSISWILLSWTKFCLKLHYNGANKYLFVNDVEIHKFKTKGSEINAIPLCLGNISKDVSVNDMKKTGLNVYDSSVDYDAITVDDIVDLQKYLMKKHDIK